MAADMPTMLNLTDHEAAIRELAAHVGKLSGKVVGLEAYIAATRAAERRTAQRREVGCAKESPQPLVYSPTAVSPERAAMQTIDAIQAQARTRHQSTAK